MTKSAKLPPGPQLGYVFVFSASDWKTVERALGKEVPDRARRLISIATLFLTLGLPIEQNAPKIGGKKSDVLKDITRLIQQAHLLRAKLFPAHYRHGKYGSPGLRDLGHRLIMELQRIDGIPKNEETIFRVCLIGLLASGFKLLRNPDEHTIHEGHAWDAWIVWMTLIAQAFKLPSGIRESDVYRVNKHGVHPQKPSPFVEMIKALQEIACPQYRRSSTDGGLTKAIGRARQLFGGPQSVDAGSVDVDELEHLLLNSLNIETHSQLNAPKLSPLAEAVDMVCGDLKPGVYPFTPEPTYLDHAVWDETLRGQRVVNFSRLLKPMMWDKGEARRELPRSAARRLRRLCVLPHHTRRWIVGLVPDLAVRESGSWKGSCDGGEHSGSSLSREMSRAKFTQADLDRISKAAAKTGVPIVAEFVAPDGSKITIAAGKGETNGGADGNDLDKWLREHNARPAEGHQ